jgi:hypothetical protein
MMKYINWLNYMLFLALHVGCSDADRHLDDLDWVNDGVVAPIMEQQLVIFDKIPPGKLSTFAIWEVKNGVFMLDNKNYDNIAAKSDSLAVLNLTGKDYEILREGALILSKYRICGVFNEGVYTSVNGPLSPYWFEYCCECKTERLDFGSRSILLKSQISGKEDALKTGGYRILDETKHLVLCY